jgi:hypothetical protein
MATLQTVAIDHTEIKNGTRIPRFSRSTKKYLKFRLVRTWGTSQMKHKDLHLGYVKSPDEWVPTFRFARALRYI